MRVYNHILSSLLMVILLLSCSSLPKHERPLSPRTQQMMEDKGLDIRSPIFIQIFKEENRLEVYKEDIKGNYVLLRGWSICEYSGELGPKLKEGDRQAPEGIYEITLGHLNPWSDYHLALNMGFPNRYDRVHGRTGAHLMIHGDCSSRGCYAMKDGPIEDIYALAREAFQGGQKKIQIQALPFRLSQENLQKHKDHKWFDFWMNLKEGTDIFAQTRRPPKAGVCRKRYVFSPKGNSLPSCPRLLSL